MKRSTIVYLIISALALIIFLPIRVLIILSCIPLFLYLIICFLEIYSPVNKIYLYSEDYFGHIMLKPKYNIIYQISKLIDK